MQGKHFSIIQPPLLSLAIGYHGNSCTHDHNKPKGMLDWCEDASKCELFWSDLNSDCAIFRRNVLSKQNVILIYDWKSPGGHFRDDRQELC